MQHTFFVEGKSITVQIPENYKRLKSDEIIEDNDLCYNVISQKFLPANNETIGFIAEESYCTIRKELKEETPDPNHIKNNDAKICINCQHHISEGFDAYRNFNHHCHKFAYKEKNIVTGKITIKNIRTCEDARSSIYDLCGINAKQYLEKSEPIEYDRPANEHPAYS